MVFYCFLGSGRDWLPFKHALDRGAGRGSQVDCRRRLLLQQRGWREIQSGPTIQALSLCPHCQSEYNETFFNDILQSFIYF